MSISVNSVGNPPLFPTLLALTSALPHGQLSINHRPLAWVPVPRGLDVGALHPPESEAIGFDNFPEFSWVVEKTEELLLRIRRVFQQDPEMFRLLVYMPKLKEGDTTPDPQTWCNVSSKAWRVPSGRLGAAPFDGGRFPEDRSDPTCELSLCLIPFAVSNPLAPV
jgi:hypothetical protein